MEGLMGNSAERTVESEPGGPPEIVPKEISLPMGRTKSRDLDVNQTLVKGSDW